MKKTKLIIAAALMAFPAMAFAHGTKVKVLREGTNAALETIEAESTELQKRVTGIKSWFSGEGVKVRVYLTENETVEMHCHQPEHDAAFECHK